MADLSEKCAVFGIYAKNSAVAHITHAGLWSLQHRGQEGTGIAVSNGTTISIKKDLGLVSQVYSAQDIQGLQGHIAVGHNRYATNGGSTREHVQPVFRFNQHIALSHNGNLPDTTKLEKFLHSVGIGTSQSNDSEMIADALSYHVVKGATLPDAVQKIYPLLIGAFSVVAMTADTLVAFRDRCGIRPLVMGTLGGGYIVSSESCVFPILDAKFLREVLPGEMVVFDTNGMQSKQLVVGKSKLDIFEFVYFARADSMFMGKRVNEVRRNFGIELAREAPVAADVIVAVPDSAFPAAEGFSEQSCILLQNGFIKNGYVHRTFIRPEQHIREKHLHMKLNPIPEVVQGKSVILVDDSIVRGTTTKQLVHILKQAGAREVHVRISSPPVLYPDFYGIDTPSQKELIAANKTVAEIQKYIGADSLAFLSYKGMINATGLPESVFCTSCFTGKYPVSIGANKVTVARVHLK
ncbi:amidophosphoribosyltransferase [Candidatus Woesebacteria bacterium]|nr:amidophosphoribosyltransferase [Candidatus Woesebacteria bacterium]